MEGVCVNSRQNVAKAKTGQGTVPKMPAKHAGEIHCNGALLCFGS